MGLMDDHRNRNYETEQNKKVLLGVFIFIVMAMVFFVEFFFAVFSIATTWLFGLIFEFFHYPLNFWHSCIMSFLVLNVTVGYKLWKTKKEKDAKV
jgi:hypothetical protein